MQHSSQLTDDFCCCLRTSEIICEEIRRSARSFLFRFYTEKQIWFSLNFDFFCLGSTSLKSFLSYYNKNTGNVYVKWRKTYSVNCIWGEQIHGGEQNWTWFSPVLMSATPKSETRPKDLKLYKRKWPARFMPVIGRSQKTSGESVSAGSLRSAWPYETQLVFNCTSTCDCLVLLLFPPFTARSEDEFLEVNQEI